MYICMYVVMYEWNETLGCVELCVDTLRDKKYNNTKHNMYNFCRHLKIVGISSYQCSQKANAGLQMAAKEEGKLIA